MMVGIIDGVAQGWLPCRFFRTRATSLEQGWARRSHTSRRSFNTVP